MFFPHHTPQNMSKIVQGIKPSIANSLTFLLSLYIFAQKRKYGCYEKDLNLDDPPGSLPTQDILWFHDLFIFLCYREEEDKGISFTPFTRAWAGKASPFTSKWTTFPAHLIEPYQTTTLVRKKPHFPDGS